MYCDFLDKGDFEMVRVLVEALNASNPGLNLGEDTIDGIEVAMRKLRQILLCELPPSFVRRLPKSTALKYDVCSWSQAFQDRQV